MKALESVASQNKFGLCASLAITASTNTKAMKKITKVRARARWLESIFSQEELEYIDCATVGLFCISNIKRLEQEGIVSGQIIQRFKQEVDYAVAYKSMSGLRRINRNCLRLKLNKEHNEQ